MGDPLNLVVIGEPEDVYYAFIRAGWDETDQSRGNLTGDPYFTDGDRLVFWVTSRPVDIADLEVEYWRIPPDRRSSLN